MASPGFEHRDGTRVGCEPLAVRLDGEDIRRHPAVEDWERGGGVSAWYDAAGAVGAAAALAVAGVVVGDVLGRSAGGMVRRVHEVGEELTTRKRGKRREGRVGRYRKIMWWGGCAVELIRMLRSQEEKVQRQACSHLSVLLAVPPHRS